MRWLFGSGIRRIDPVFGAMLYMGDRLKYWEGKAKFGPDAGREIEVFVDASETEDLTRQHQFYEELTEQWETLSVKIKSAVAEKVGEAPDVVLTSVSVARAPLSTADWELTFTSRGGDESATVRMKGQEPIGVALDT